ncbi:MAG: tyrosine-type recombinase/integrase [Nitrososphaeraceae archaeon]
MNKTTAHEYLMRLNNFRNFVLASYNGKFTVDEFVSKVREGSEDPYTIIRNYAAFQQRNNNISNSTLKFRVVTLKNFLEFYDVDISPRKFKLKVKLPKVVRKTKEALSKEDVIDILNTCSDIRLKTYLMLLASTGMRPVEALSIRVKDLGLKSNPSRLFVRGEYTKTRSDRTIFLTQELDNQLSSWLSYRYRRRRICYSENGKTVTQYRTPSMKDSDLVFSTYRLSGNPNPVSLYVEFRTSFAKTLDRMGKGAREDSNERRRKITLHSFRRFVKTTISDLGYQDFSEYFIGHSGSMYWTKKESEKAEIFRKIESYLTFLNVHQLERQGADIQSKIEELEELNQSFRERDMMKDDAIAHLSDQLMALTVRMQDLERRR